MFESPGNLGLYKVIRSSTYCHLFLCTILSRYSELLGLFPWEGGTAKSQVPAPRSTACSRVVWTSLVPFSRADKHHEALGLLALPRLSPSSLLSLLPPLLPQKPLGTKAVAPATFHSLLGGDFCWFSNLNPVRRVCASCVCLQLKESSIPINLSIICASQQVTSW